MLLNYNESREIQFEQIRENGARYLVQIKGTAKYIPKLFVKDNSRQDQNILRVDDHFLRSQRLIPIIE